MSEAPKPSETIKIGKILTEMTLESRIKNNTIPAQQNHLQVSTEFLGGRFDTKG